jgi:hypothetical protein
VCECFYSSLLILYVNRWGEQRKEISKVIRYFGKQKQQKKYADQYVDELEIYFPEIEKRSYAEMVKA